MIKNTNAHRSIGNKLIKNENYYVGQLQKKKNKKVSYNYPLKYIGDDVTVVTAWTKPSHQDRVHS